MKEDALLVAPQLLAGVIVADTDSIDEIVLEKSTREYFLLSGRDWNLIDELP
jgi:hypothetical protein